MAKKANKKKAKSKSTDSAASAQKPEKKMKFAEFQKELEKLQVELCRMQRWVKQNNARVVVIFEGRDAAGKGGVIKRITDRVSPRVFRTVALPTPTEREKSQVYVQRYMAHLPAGGEVILFDRSWYNRAGVERVMGFCTDQEYERFMRICPAFERELVLDGIILIKYFFDVSQEEQARRFARRAEDPLRHWKLSPMDVESSTRWWDYTEAFERMIRHTDTEIAPWYRVPASNKRRARLNCISHLLSKVPYERIPYTPPPFPKMKKKKPNQPEDIRFTYTVPQIY